MTQRERVFAFLNDKYEGDTIDDYDSREKLLDYIIEDIGMEDDITCMCGVGPLMNDIEDWLEQFCNQGK